MNEMDLHDVLCLTLCIDAADEICLPSAYRVCFAMSLI